MSAHTEDKVQALIVGLTIFSKHGGKDVDASRAEILRCRIGWGAPELTKAEVKVLDTHGWHYDVDEDNFYLDLR